MSTRSTVSLQEGDIHEFMLPEPSRKSRTPSRAETEADNIAAEVRENFEETQEETFDNIMPETTTTEYQQLMVILGKVADNLNTMATAQNVVVTGPIIKN